MGYLILLLIAIGGVWLAISALKDMTSPKQLQEEEHSRPIHDSKEILELKRRMQKMAEEQGFVITGWGDVFVEEDGKLGIECYTHVPDGKEGEYVDRVTKELGATLKNLTIIPDEKETEPQGAQSEGEKEESKNKEEVTSLAETENKEVHYHIKGDVHVAGDLHLNGDILTDSSSKSSALTLKK